MPHTSIAAVLIALPGLALESASRRRRAARATIDLTTVTAPAQQYLHAAAAADKQTAGVRVDQLHSSLEEIPKKLSAGPRQAAGRTRSPVQHSACIGRNGTVSGTARLIAAKLKEPRCAAHRSGHQTVLHGQRIAPSAIAISEAASPSVTARQAKPCMPARRSLG